MKCTKCGNDLRCKVSLKTEDSGDRPIEISYQWWYCEKCGAKYFGTLEDSSVNMFDDRVLHKGDEADETRWQETLKLALKCPDEGNTSCTCEAHKDAPPFSVGGAAWYTND